MLPTASKTTDGRNVTTGEGTSAIARDRGSTNTALPAGSSHLTINKRSTNVKHDGESHNSGDEENPDVTAFEQEVNRFQSRGKPDPPAKGKQPPPPNPRKPPAPNPLKPPPINPRKPPPPNPQKPPPPTPQGTFTPVPPQQPPTPTQGVAMQGNRTPATTAYRPTTAPSGRGK